MTKASGFLFSIILHTHVYSIKNVYNNALVRARSRSLVSSSQPFMYVSKQIKDKTVG